MYVLTSRKKGDGKGKIFGESKYIFCRGEEKGGTRKYLEKENIPLVEKRGKTERAKEENIWRGKIFFLRKKRKMERKRKKIFREGKGGNY